MCGNNTEKSKEYDKTRSSFKDLGSNEQATFLLESTIQLVVDGVRQAGDAVSEALKTVSSEFAKKTGESEPAAEKEAEAKPPKAASEPKKKKQSSASKKAAKDEPDSTD
jgi:hypothetical protein